MCFYLKDSIDNNLVTQYDNYVFNMYMHFRYKQSYKIKHREIVCPEAEMFTCRLSIRNPCEVQWADLFVFDATFSENPQHISFSNLIICFCKCLIVPWCIFLHL